MKCEQCGTEAISMEGHIIREATGSEATLILRNESGTIVMYVCDGCAATMLDSDAQLEWDLLCTPRPHNLAPSVIVEGYRAKVALNIKRCIGCKWRIPRKFGGEGIMCHQTNGKCPRWVVQWALNHCGYKSFTTDEQLLEALRL